MLFFPKYQIFLLLYSCTTLCTANFRFGAVQDEFWVIHTLSNYGYVQGKFKGFLSFTANALSIRVSYVHPSSSSDE